MQLRTCAGRTWGLLFQGNARTNNAHMYGQPSYSLTENAFPS
ncbi:MAG: hypothetical protein R2788_01920 [Saprospiraceae bacterium]